jgi:raffinose/stachyose/melibiose transport system substrate-binding protein
VLWYNKALLAKAGIDAKSLESWDGLLDATRKLKAAGVTPFSVGGGIKWPLNMFWACLAVRIGGKQAFMDAMNRTGPGFDSPVFLQVSEKFKQLIDLEPFQKGFLSDAAPEASGLFGDGKVAMQLMGNWAYQVQKAQSVSQQGVPDADLGWLPCPQVAGGKGDPSDSFGGTNGFLVTKDAPPEAVEFLKFYTSLEIQREAAKNGFYIPATKGAGEALQNPIFRELAASLQKANYVQNFYDQMLGPATGRVVNDTSQDLAAGRISPKQVGRLIQDAWDLEH